MRNFKKCLITGGRGLLGSNLIPFFNKGEVLNPSSKAMDICEADQVEFFFKQNRDIDLVIHTAAYTDVESSETNFVQCSHVNVVGTFNILKECHRRNAKLVYISTDAVFDGKKGNYTTGDCVNPISNYAKTKTAGELMVRTYRNSLVIRTSFFGLEFPYEHAFEDQWTSKDYIDTMAPKIFETCISNRIGISHVCSDRSSLHELAIQRNPGVKKIKMSDFKIGYELPIDLSLKTG